MKVNSTIWNTDDEDNVSYNISFLSDGSSGNVWLMNYRQLAPNNYSTFSWSRNGNYHTFMVWRKEELFVSYIVVGTTCSMAESDGSEITEYIYTKES